jgi:hypothetical protein
MTMRRKKSVGKRKRKKGGERSWEVEKEGGTKEQCDDNVNCSGGGWPVGGKR